MEIRSRNGGTRWRARRLTEITLHHICETHRTCCVDLVGGSGQGQNMQRDEITCNAAARRTLSAFGLISSILDDMINDRVQRGIRRWWSLSCLKLRTDQVKETSWRSTKMIRQGLGYEPIPLSPQLRHQAGAFLSLKRAPNGSQKNTGPSRSIYPSADLFSGQAENEKSPQNRLRLVFLLRRSRLQFKCMISRSPLKVLTIAENRQRYVALISPSFSF